MINLDLKHLQFIKETFDKILPEVEVWAFGSRITSNFKPYSDLDLGLRGKEKIPSLKMVELREDFEESNLPIKIDLVDWQRIDENFKKIIKANYSIL